MNQTIYAVIGYNQFYPNPDNIIKAFYSENKAHEFLEVVKETVGYNSDFYEVIEIEIEDDE